MGYPRKVDAVTPCMYLYKAKIKSDGILDKLKLRIVVGGDFQNKEIIGYIWYPTASMRTLKCSLVDTFNHKSMVDQFYFSVEFL